MYCLIIKNKAIAAPKARINHQIKAPEVRVIDDSGKMVGVMKLHEALQLGEERGVDIVEVSPHANPPVVKLLNYDKFRYQQEKLSQQAKKKVKKVTVKIIRMTVRIGEHDLNFKTKQASGFLSEGHKVKIDVTMKGREQAHPELAFNLINKFRAMIKTEFILESGPSRMGGTVSILIGPESK